MLKSVVISPLAPDPVGPYPHAVRAGNLLFVSGMGPRKKGSGDIAGVTLDSAGRVVSYDIATQCRSAFDNIRIILEHAGAKWENIVDVTVFLTNLKQDFATYNKVYAEHFPSNRPARTTVEVTALPTPIAIEVKVVAILE